MNKRKTERLYKCLDFVSSHLGTRRNAFPCGYNYDFIAPECKRIPFKRQTLEELISAGLVVVTDTHIGLSESGRLALHAYKKYGMIRQ